MLKICPSIYIYIYHYIYIYIPFNIIDLVNSNTSSHTLVVLYLFLFLFFSFEKNLPFLKNYPYPVAMYLLEYMYIYMCISTHIYIYSIPNDTRYIYPFDCIRLYPLPVLLPPLPPSPAQSKSSEVCRMHGCTVDMSICLYLSAVAPHLQPFTFDEANSGDLIIVHCAVVKGDTPISLKWLFEGRHLEVGDGVGITALGDRVSALTIPAVRGEHAGEYACVADNPAGRARHSAHLKVNGTEHAATLLFS